MHINVFTALSAAAEKFREENSDWNDSSDLSIRIFEELDGTYRARFWNYENYNALIWLTDSPEEVRAILSGDEDALNEVDNKFDSDSYDVEQADWSYETRCQMS